VGKDKGCAPGYGEAWPSAKERSPQSADIEMAMPPDGSLLAFLSVTIKAD